VKALVETFRHFAATHGNLPVVFAGDWNMNVEEVKNCFHTATRGYPYAFQPYYATEENGQAKYTTTGRRALDIFWTIEHHENSHMGLENPRVIGPGPDDSNQYEGREYYQLWRTTPQRKLDHYPVVVDVTSLLSPIPSQLDSMQEVICTMKVALDDLTSKVLMQLQDSVQRQETMQQSIMAALNRLEERRTDQQAHPVPPEHPSQARQPIPNPQVHQPARDHQNPPEQPGGRIQHLPGTVTLKLSSQEDGNRQPTAERKPSRDGRSSLADAEEALSEPVRKHRGDSVPSAKDLAKEDPVRESGGNATEPDLIVPNGRVASTPMKRNREDWHVYDLTDKHNHNHVCLMKKHGDQEDTYDVTQDGFRKKLLERGVQSTVNVDKRTSESLNKKGKRWKVMRLDSCGHFGSVTDLSGALTSVRLEKSKNVKERPNKVAERLRRDGQTGVFAFALDGSQGTDEPQADRTGMPAAASQGDALETPGVPASDPSRARGYSTPVNDAGKTSNTGPDDRTEGNPLDDVQIVSDSVVKVRPTLDAQLLSAASNGRWELSLIHI